MTTDKEMANAIRFLAIDAIEQANSGHPGMVMGMADVAYILYSEFLKFNPNNPAACNRDRFILSAGHGSMLLYAILYLTGYKDYTIDEIKNFRKLHSKTPGHPEYSNGIETTTGPLGQGLGNAVGIALACKLTGKNYHTYALVGDGCLMEGLSEEVISFAGHHNLHNLIVLFDDNQITIDGPTSLTTSTNMKMRFEANNWDYLEISGHNFDEIRTALKQATSASKPTLIACKTIIAYGAQDKAGSNSAHGSPLGATEVANARKNLGWDHPPFVVPDNILNKWRSFGTSENNTESPETFQINHLTLEKVESESTRKSSGKVLQLLAKQVPQLVGGSADLSASCETKQDNITYINYGVREHGMGAIMNGLALSGLIPYGSTFLTFSDYMRPAIRLAAIMKLKVIYVMTHDSIGLGEDGPTHQPIEHLASFRAMPDLYLFRPIDRIEVLETWKLALSLQAPSIIALSRQNLTQVREYSSENQVAKGAYILKDVQDPDVTIFGTSSEIEIAYKAEAILQKSQIKVRIISVPCFRLFDEQEALYKQKILGGNHLKIAIEAGTKFGWEKFIGIDGIFIGMDSFGASGNASDLYEYFNITAENIVKQVEDYLHEKNCN